jgi:hypothetical protein
LSGMHGFLHSLLDPLEKLLAALGLGFPELVTIFILGMLVTSLCWGNIFIKAGFRSFRGYLMLIPVVNVFVFFRFALGKWPIEQQLQQKNALLEVRNRKSFLDEPAIAAPPAERSS